MTITADSEVGEVDASDELLVSVSEDPGIVAEGFETGSTAKTAFRSLTVVVQSLAQAGIWLVIFSPIWGVIVALAWLLIRRLKRRGVEGRARIAEAQRAAAEARTEETSGGE